MRSKLYDFVLMSRLGPIFIVIAIAACLGLPQFGEGAPLSMLALGLALVVGGILLAAYAVTASLRFVTLPPALVRREDSRRWGWELALLDTTIRKNKALELIPEDQP